jgi:hypothetical protein
MKLELRLEDINREVKRLESLISRIELLQYWGDAEFSKIKIEIWENEDNKLSWEPMTTISYTCPTCEGSGESVEGKCLKCDLGQCKQYRNWSQLKQEINEGCWQ